MKEDSYRYQWIGSLIISLLTRVLQIDFVLVTLERGHRIEYVTLQELSIVRYIT